MVQGGLHAILSGMYVVAEVVGKKSINLDGDK